jgi:hypothetical protein
VVRRIGQGVSVNAKRRELVEPPIDRHVSRRRRLRRQHAQLRVPPLVEGGIHLVPVVRHHHHRGRSERFERTHTLVVHGDDAVEKKPPVGKAIHGHISRHSGDRQRAGHLPQVGREGARRAVRKDLRLLRVRALELPPRLTFTHKRMRELLHVLVEPHDALALHIARRAAQHAESASATRSLGRAPRAGYCFAHEKRAIRRGRVLRLDRRPRVQANIPRALRPHEARSPQHADRGSRPEGPRRRQAPRADEGEPRRERRSS